MDTRNNSGKSSSESAYIFLQTLLSAKKTNIPATIPGDI